MFKRHNIAGSRLFHRKCYASVSKATLHAKYDTIICCLTLNTLANRHRLSQIVENTVNLVLLTKVQFITLSVFVYTDDERDERVARVRLRQLKLVYRGLTNEQFSV